MGEDLDITVQYEDSTPVIMAPMIPVDVEEGIRELDINTRGSVVSRFSGHSSNSGSSCSTTPRPCVFVAGLGQKVDYGLSSHDLMSYFGKEIREHAPCCSSIQYIELATNLYGWYDEILAQRLVSLLVQVSSTSDASTGTVLDTIIFAHSMGNNMLANAIANGHCSLDSSTTWIAASAPMGGSMGSDFIQMACSGKLTGVVSSLLHLFDECPVTAGRLALAYQTGSYASPELVAAYTAAQVAYAENVHAVMCSKSYTGRSSVIEVAYILAGKTVPHKSRQNDGIVEYASCAKGLPAEPFASSTGDKY
ncbi:unnamed protein product [Phytophthora fragariaefolia]|uniref:Unnamed protein product n=1 Tax=Phytophthora fragariaefolia TaxID=1490495 RepID=A0A9W6YE70_9STRA|nr:unnamed protein product [Phytophthora fragariaefolia]